MNSPPSTPTFQGQVTGCCRKICPHFPTQIMHEDTTRRRAYNVTSGTGVGFPGRPLSPKPKYPFSTITKGTGCLPEVNYNRMQSVGMEKNRNAQRTRSFTFSRLLPKLVVQTMSKNFCFPTRTNKSGRGGRKQHCVATK